MSMSAFRRSAQRLSSVNWSATVFKGDPELSSMVAGFRAWTAQADAMAEKYSAPPGPIDFSTAKSSVRDVALVDALESLYKSASPPAITYEWSSEEQAKKAELIKGAEAGLAFNQEMIDDTEKEIALLRTNRTTHDSSPVLMAEVYPDIAEEIEDEIENREWFKDTLNK
eukprot:CAMPEP_0201603676 /NCGR_PEP_ID=MMETSP0492-20130828/4043_1 /ASSEMBLY_ACC=CAM_ASM_000837 /TAXON_ID=420259 /ORGANISM="Thalassiosira gravida, Strain GMp14c1" /LENGTH=168 /DNA_ID=CAMNT_0048067505 /DNA_START=86 /DNA_END=592 /DNA_ORIENTATION=+